MLDVVARGVCEAPLSLISAPYLILPELGKMKNGTNEKARRVLGWESRSNEECIVAAAESLVRFGLVKA